jgi:membrane-bound lytic murein transglycosylase D
MIFNSLIKTLTGFRLLLIGLAIGILASCATQTSHLQTLNTATTTKPNPHTEQTLRADANSDAAVQANVSETVGLLKSSRQDYKISKVHFAPTQHPDSINKISYFFDQGRHVDAVPKESVLSDVLFNSITSAQGTTIIDLLDEPDAESELVLQNLWDRLRMGFQLNHDHPGIKGELNWYSTHQAYLDRVVDRARPYLHMIVTEIEKRGMPTEIALLPIVESAFQPFAYSHGRAAGIWQFIPGTGRLYGLKQNWWYDGRRDIYASTQAALNYLQKLSNDFNGNWQLALAAYNSGEGTVAKAIRKNLRKGKPIDFWSLDLPRETQGYVPKLLAIAAIIADPSAYGITLESIKNNPKLVKVDIDDQIDLSLAAELAGISVEEIYRLNPGFNRWATDPNGPHYLLLPIDRENRFAEQLASLAPEKRITWSRHRIRHGETLAGIAKRYHTTTKVLRQVNNIRGNMIRAGRNLIIPAALNSPDTYVLSAEQRKKKIQNKTRNGRKIRYTVKSGDSFWKIARRYGVGVRKLASWNAMAPRDPLRAGQKLVIWTDKNHVAMMNPSRIATPPQNQIQRSIHYIVRKGDSLARIAKKFKVTISQLRRWNRLSKSRYLQPGQKLKLFIDVTRQSG